MTESLFCPAYLEKRCASCTSLINPVELYLKKFLVLQSSISQAYPDAEYLEPELLPNPFKSRAKAKLQIGGSLSEPQIGLDKRKGDKFFISPLLDCPLHTPGINPILLEISKLITKHSLTPYSIEQRSGELKGIIVLETNSGIGVRFVSRSRELEPAYKRAAADLFAINPNVKSVSLNIQPIPHQIVEGEEEHLLLGDSFLKQVYGDFFVHLPPLSFVQVTPLIATALYQTARLWLSDRSDRNTLDLFCGAGGFLMAVAFQSKSGRGIELRDDAIKCANEAAILQGYKHLSFTQGDLSNLKITDSFDTVIVNPPRRGLGKELIDSLCKMKPKQILYSSCNAETLISDIELLGYLPKKVKAFDMFPLTNHLEVLALLE